MTSISWQLLEETTRVLRELDRYAMELDGAARAKQPLPDPPEGIVARITEALNRANFALTVHNEDSGLADQNAWRKLGDHEDEFLAEYWFDGNYVKLPKTVGDTILRDHQTIIDLKAQLVEADAKWQEERNRAQILVNAKDAENAENFRKLLEAKADIDSFKRILYDGVSELRNWRWLDHTELFLKEYNEQPEAR